MTPAEVVALAVAAVLVLAGAGWWWSRRRRSTAAHRMPAAGWQVGVDVDEAGRALPVPPAPARRWPAAAYDPPTGPIALPLPPTTGERPAVTPAVADDRRADAGPPPGTAERRRVDLGPGGRHRREDVTGELSATSILRRLNAGDSPDTALGR